MLDKHLFIPYSISIFVFLLFGFVSLCSAPFLHLLIMQFCRLKTLLVSRADADPRQIYSPLLTVNDVVCCGSFGSLYLSRSPSISFLMLSRSIASCEEAKLANSYCYSAEPAEAQFKFGCDSVRKRNEAKTQKVAEKRFPL